MSVARLATAFVSNIQLFSVYIGYCRPIILCESESRENRSGTRYAQQYHKGRAPGTSSPGRTTCKGRLPVQPGQWARSPSRMGPVDNMMHLRSLQEYELKPLHPLLKSLADDPEQIVEQWYQLYASQSVRIEHFRRKNSPASCRRFFAAVRRPCSIATSNSLERSAGRWASGWQDAAFHLFEVILSLHLCQESIEALCAEEIPLPMESSFAQTLPSPCDARSRRLYPDGASQFICPESKCSKTTAASQRPRIGEISTACLARAPRCGGSTTGSRPPAGLEARC